MTEDAIADDEEGSHKAPLLAAFGALGVVYGDIGTSPLQALKQAVTAAQGGPGPSDVAVIGAVSLILWALVLIVARPARSSASCTSPRTGRRGGTGGRDADRRRGLLGVPVSTTHVVTGGITGTMVGSGAGIKPSTLWQIGKAWILTLPVTIVLSGGLFSLLS